MYTVDHLRSFLGPTIEVTLDENCITIRPSAERPCQLCAIKHPQWNNVSLPSGVTLCMEGFLYPRCSRIHQDPGTYDDEWAINWFYETYGERVTLKLVECCWCSGVCLVDKRGEDPLDPSYEAFLARKK